MSRRSSPDWWTTAVIRRAGRVRWRRAREARRTVRGGVVRMVMEALRGYVQLASGLTEVTRERARSAARAVLAQAGHLGDSADTRTQVRALAEDLANTARANRDLLLGMVRTETELVVASLGLVTGDDVS